MSGGPVILALDQSSTRTGYVRGRPEGPVVLGSYSNGTCNEQYGKALLRYEAWLESMLDGVDLLAFEQPVRPFQSLNLHTARLLYGIAGVIEMVSERRRVDCFEVDTGEMKKLIFGKGGKKPDESVAKRHARRWGFDATNGDEADAAGVFLFAIQHQYPDAFDRWLDRRAAA
ncbi:MAG: hypothetical protein GC208_09590 [Alphaproteobacteria bacterium]|nr:hypothetical protein [Alphaproteobacteria bacterium]